MIEQKEWETEIEEKDLINIFSKNKKYFDGNGGDVDNLIAKMQILNTRRNFGKESLYNLTLQDLEEAMDIFTSTKQSINTDPPFGMYN
jgi:hypothetical protein